MQRDGALHEFGPDREGGFGPLDLEFSVIVEADPNDAQKIRGETGEPAIRRVGTGFSRRDRREAASAHPGAVPLRITSCSISTKAALTRGSSTGFVSGF